VTIFTFIKVVHYSTITFRIRKYHKNMGKVWLENEFKR